MLFTQADVVVSSLCSIAREIFGNVGPWLRHFTDALFADKNFAECSLRSRFWDLVWFSVDDYLTIYWVNILTLNIQFNRAWSCEETAVESTLIKRVILNVYILQSQAAFSEWNASGIIMYNFATSQFRFCGQTSPVFAVHGLFSRPCYQMEYIGFLLLFWSENIFAR